MALANTSSLGREPETGGQLGHRGSICNDPIDPNDPMGFRLPKSRAHGLRVTRDVWYCLVSFFKDKVKTGTYGYLTTGQIDSNVARIFSLVQGVLF